MSLPSKIAGVSRRELQRVNRVLRSEFTSGLLVIAAAALGLIAANSPLSGSYEALRDFKIGPSSIHLELSIGTWAADGLLAVFFFIVGLELKQELAHGSLRNLRVAAVPIAAAFGGVLVPALIYVACTADTDAAPGWAIPTATDIAFAIAVLGLIAPRLPPALRVFLLTLAVVDDFIAIAIIAVFYGDGVQPQWALLALAPLAAFALLCRLLPRAFATRHWPGILLLVPLAITCWALVHASGIHATVAGVLLAATVPVGASRSESPARRIDLAEVFAHRLAPFSSGIAVPVFAFFAAGVAIGGVSGFFADPITFGVVFGLVIGKPLGITVTALLMSRITGARLQASRREMVGVGCLAGIGFTVAMLIAQLSFTRPEQGDAARLAVMVGSVIAAACAAGLLLRPGHGTRNESVMDR